MAGFFSYTQMYHLGMSNQNLHIHKSSSSAVYCLGMFGAAVYYLQHATSFSNGLLGIFKAIFWPAFFVYKAIEMFQI